MKHSVLAIVFVFVANLAFSQSSEPEEFYNYLSEAIMIPRQAANAKADGIFFVTFKASADGVISDINIPKPLGVGYDQEATKALTGTPPNIVTSLVTKTGATDFVVPIRFDVSGLSAQHVERKYSDANFYLLHEVLISKVRPKGKKK
jgi:hypothetical protein